MAVAPLATSTPLAGNDNQPAPAVEQVTVTAQRDKEPDPFSPQELKAKLNDTEDKISAINDSTGALQPPKWDMPPPPEPKQTDAGQAWGSAAMMLAAAGSLLTRTPITTALNSMAGVLKAAKQNDLEEANRQFETWKASTELAVKQENFQMEAYKSALQKANTDERTALAEFTAYAHAFSDNTALAMAKERNWYQMQHLIIDRERAANTMEKNMPDIISAHAFVNAYHSPEFQAKLKTAKNPQEQMQMVLQLQSGLTDADITRIAEQANAGDPTAKQNAGRGKPGQAAMALINAKQTELLAAQGKGGGDLATQDAVYQGLKASMRTLGNTSARIGLGVAELKRLEPQVRQASAELKRSGYPSLNAAIQAGQAATGSPELRNLAVRLQGLKSAFSQVLTRGGVPTDSARATTDELFSTKDPDGVLDAALGAMNSEAQAIEQAPGDVRRKLTGSFVGKTYKTPDEVKRAVQAKDISPQDGMQILQDQFGFTQ